MNEILPKCQYYSYIEIDRRNYSGKYGSLIETYEGLKSNHPNFTSRVIREVNEIWPTFKGLFEKTK